MVQKLENDMNLNAEARACTGVLAVHPRSRDVKIDNFSINFHGVEILADTKLELNCGRRYGLIGLNGSGAYLNFKINSRLADFNMYLIFYQFKYCKMS